MGYIEIHIEQGTVLEKANRPIGIVTGIVGIRDLVVRVTGEDTHSGPLDMHLRRDALVGAARMIIEANAIGLAAAPDARVTVGRISVPSGSHSVVPGFAEFIVDLRHPEAAGLDVLEERVRAAFSAIAHRSHLALAFESVWEYPPVEFDAVIRSVIRDSAARLGHSTLVLPSRAGHDAWNIAQVAPAGMIFIPCREEISHNEAEFASFDHIAASADVCSERSLRSPAPPDSDGLVLDCARGAWLVESLNRPRSNQGEVLCPALCPGRFASPPNRQELVA